MPKQSKNRSRASRFALVTGGVRRVGRSIAIALGRAGFDIVLHCRKADASAQRTADLIRTTGQKCWLAPADLRDPAACRQMIVQALKATEGRMDVLVNNAAIFYPSPVSQSAGQWDRAWDELMAVNALAPAVLAHALAPALAKRRGCIVNIADICWDHPWRDHAAYSASKAALVSLTLSLARDLAPRVRVNAIAPGIVAWPEEYSAKTRRQLLARVPLQRPGTPQDVAGAVAFLVQNQYLTGVILPVDGGRRLT